MLVNPESLFKNKTFRGILNMVKTKMKRKALLWNGQKSEDESVRKENF